MPPGERFRLYQQVIAQRDQIFLYLTLWAMMCVAGWLLVRDRRLLWGGYGLLVVVVFGWMVFAWWVK